MTFKDAIERQKARDWSGARALWKAVDAHTLRDLNLAICHSWLGDCGEALVLLDRYESWPDILPGLAGLSERSLRLLRQSFLAVELYAADCEGETNRVNQCVEKLAALGGELHDLVRTPVAIVWEDGQLDVLEDVVNVGDLLIPLTTYCAGIRRSPSTAARRLARLYSELKRDGLEPLTTNKERIAEVLGMTGRPEPRVFTPLEWQGSQDVREVAEIDNMQADALPAPSRSREVVDQHWPGFRDQLAAAFQTLVEEEARPGREESPAEYARLYYIVKEFASYLPYWRVLMKPGRSLYRARIVSHATCEQDISYAPDRNLVQEFGRVNAPEESIFYCASDARTAVAEVLNDWFDTAHAGDTRQVCVGRWLTVQDIQGAFVPYHDEALSLSPLRKVVHREMERMREEYTAATYNLLRDCLTYLGSVYARRARNSLDYWSTTAYFNFVTNPRNFEHVGHDAPSGLFYPSVQMKYRGDNFATFPHIVHSAMRCIDASAISFRCLGSGRFSYEGTAPRWFSKVSCQFEF